MSASEQRSRDAATRLKNNPATRQVLEDLLISAGLVVTGPYHVEKATNVSANLGFTPCAALVAALCRAHKNVLDKP